MVILTPDPYVLVRTFRIGEVSEMEEAGAYDALVRTRDWAFGRTSPPSWLKYGLQVLGCEPKGNRKNTKVRNPHKRIPPDLVLPRSSLDDSNQHVQSAMSMRWGGLRTGIRRGNVTCQP